MTVVDLEADPPPPVQVIVYDFVAVSAPVDVDPVAATTAPVLKVHPVAFELDQLSVELALYAIELGDAENAFTVGAGVVVPPPLEGGGVVVPPPVEPPPPLVGGGVVVPPPVEPLVVPLPVVAPVLAGAVVVEAAADAPAIAFPLWSTTTVLPSA